MAHQFIAFGHGREFSKALENIGSASCFVYTVRIFLYNGFIPSLFINYCRRGNDFEFSISRRINRAPDK